MDHATQKSIPAKIKGISGAAPPCVHDNGTKKARESDGMLAESSFRAILQLIAPLRCSHISLATLIKAIIN